MDIHFIFSKGPTMELCYLSSSVNTLITHNKNQYSVETRQIENTDSSSMFVLVLLFVLCLFGLSSFFLILASRREITSLLNCKLMETIIK